MKKAWGRCDANTPVPERWGRGIGAEPVCRYALELPTTGGIVFSVASPRPVLEKAAHPAAGFVAGLWRTDCAELFLGNPHNRRYVEFNLGPGGAWWACGFSAPRVAAQQDWQDCIGEQKGSEVSAHTQWEHNHWLGWLRLPLIPVARMLQGVNPDGWTANVTFITGNGDNQRYFSVAELAGERPDFHQPDYWPSLGQITRPGIRG